MPGVAAAITAKWASELTSLTYWRSAISFADLCTRHSTSSGYSSASSTFPTPPASNASSIPSNAAGRASLPLSVLRPLLRYTAGGRADAKKAGSSSTYCTASTS